MEKSIQIKGIKKSEYPKLYTALENIATAYNTTKIRVHVFSRGTNAFAISVPLFGDFLFITKKVIEIMNEEEIKAVVAHEFSHLFNRDYAVKLIVCLFFSWPLLLLLIITSYYNISLIEGRIGVLCLIFVILFVWGIRATNWTSTLLEVRSDREAALKTKNPKAMKNALLKLYSTLFGRNGRPSYFEKISEGFEYLFLYFCGFTHPSLRERVEQLELVEKMIESQKN